MKMLEGQPSLLPRPNCMRLRAWGKHNAVILAQIPHPDYPQHGWMGMVIQPHLFALINTKPFVPPMDPGRLAVYPQYATAAAMNVDIDLVDLLYEEHYPAGMCVLRIVTVRSTYISLSPTRMCVRMTMRSFTLGMFKVQFPR
jgi:hypothetical protein